MKKHSRCSLDIFYTNIYLHKMATVVGFILKAQSSAPPKSLNPDLADNTTW